MECNKKMVLTHESSKPVPISKKPQYRSLSGMKLGSVNLNLELFMNPIGSISFGSQFLFLLQTSWPQAGGVLITKLQLDSPQRVHLTSTCAAGRWSPYTFRGRVNKLDDCRLKVCAGSRGGSIPVSVMIVIGTCKG